MSLKINHLHFESDKILSSLSEADKHYFLSFGELFTFKRGKLIFYEDGIPTGIFLIKKGKAKIYKTSAEGKDQIFYIYKEGDLFGYHSLLCNENYEDSCEAIEDCELLFISKSKFHHLLNKIDNLKLLFIQNISHEFGVLVNTISILAQKSLRERLALYLLILYDRFHEEEHAVACINLTREDLANIIGTARESLGRLLKEFKEDGVISIEGRTIYIRDLVKLKRLAGKS